MSTDRPDLPTFDGRDVREHANSAAAAVRAINHITGWPHGMTYPSDAYTVLGRLASVAAMVPQAVGQIDHTVTGWHAAGHIGIDRGQPFAANPGEAVVAAASALARASDRAAELYEALDTATQALAYAHWTGLHTDADDERSAATGGDL
jgi:hypothetical protein